MRKSFGKIRLLTNALLKNSMAEADPFKHKSLKIVISIIGTTIMVGCAVVVGYFTQILTTAVSLLHGNGTEAMQLILYFINIFGAVFGVNVVCGLLYFSMDLSRLLPYPFKPAEISMSKCIVAYLQESIMEFMVIIGILVGYMLANGFSVLGVLFSICGVVLLPVLPLFYCAFFAILFMSIAKKIHSVKGVNLVSAMCGVVFTLIFVASLLQLEDITTESFVVSLADGSNVFLNIMQYIFFSIPLLCMAISQQSILYFLLFLAAHVVMIVVLYLLSAALYSYGLTAVMSAGKKHSENKIKKSKIRTVFSTSLNREIKTLLRTPTYITNCILPTLLLPVLGIALLISQKGKEFHDFIYSFNAPDTLIFIAVITAVTLVTAMNSLSASAFTREGNHADLLKYLPIPYKLQIQVKVVVSLIFSLPTAIIGVILLCCAVIGDNIVLMLLCVAASAITVAATIYLGILFDAMHPKLVWEDELSALRGNMSTFLHMAVAIAFGIILGILYVLIGEYLYVPIVLGILLIAAVILAVYCSRKSEKLLEEMIV